MIEWCGQTSGSGVPAPSSDNDLIGNLVNRICLRGRMNSVEASLWLFERVAQNVEVFQRETCSNSNRRQRIVGDVAGNPGHLS
jgi:hypothetical protein